MGSGQKYPFWDDSTNTPVTQKEAFEKMEDFIKTCRDSKVSEYSFHLYIQDDQYKMFANSVKYLATGKHVKEFKV